MPPLWSDFFSLFLFRTERDRVLRSQSVFKLAVADSTVSDLPVPETSSCVPDEKIRIVRSDELVATDDESISWKLTTGTGSCFVIACQAVE